MIKLFKKKTTIEEKIHLIQSGDEKAREMVIKDYFPFVIQTLSKVLNRYIEVENDPYISIGLEAFNKALDKYDLEKGSFVAFSEKVIKNACFDEMRKEKKHAVISYVETSELDHIEDEDVFETQERQDEMFVYKHLLRSFDIDIEGLIKNSPKHKETRLEAIRAGSVLSSSTMMMNYLYEKKKIPRKQLVERSQLTEKKIRYNRDFIIAVAIALKEEITFVKNYILAVGGEVK